MVKVFFETNSTAVLVAIFDDEETYMYCLPGLKKLKKKGRWTYITESIKEITLNELINKNE